MAGRAGQAPILACLLATLLVTACSPKTGGAMALFVRDGTLFAQIAVCEGSVDGLTIWHQETASDDSEEVDDRRVELEARRPGDHEVAIGQLLDGQSASLMLTSGVDYGVLAGSRDNEWSITGPDFTLEDVVALLPGDLLTSDSSGNVEVVQTNPEKWAREECADW